MNGPLWNEKAEREILSRAFNEGGLGSFFEIAPNPCVFSPKNRLIYEAVLELHNRGESTDCIGVTNHLREMGQFEEVGGVRIISDIEKNPPFDALLHSSIQEVNDLWMKREQSTGWAEANKRVDEGDYEGARAIIERLDSIIPGSPRLKKKIPITVSIKSLREQSGRDLPPDIPYIGDWFIEMDFGIIFGQRGLGKSWLSMLMAAALVEGGNFGPWKVHRARKVLYIDGEMKRNTLISRFKMLMQWPEMPENLLTLSHKDVYEETEISLCLSERKQQSDIVQHCVENGVNVIFIDNGSCLFRGVSENDADSYCELIEPFILELRRRGISVVLVLHAGRDPGKPRGHSKREDIAEWIIGLGESHKRESQNGASFISRFGKWRNCENAPEPRAWNFVSTGGGVDVRHEVAGQMEIFLHLVDTGVCENKKMAEAMGVSPSRISQIAKKARDAGHLKPGGDKYELA